MGQSNVLIEIIGTTGTSYNSDIAIDEITVDVGTNSCGSSCNTACVMNSLSALASPLTL